jgi:hypothetical protein
VAVTGCCYHPYLGLLVLTPRPQRPLESGALPLPHQTDRYGFRCLRRGWGEAVCLINHFRPPWKLIKPPLRLEVGTLLSKLELSGLPYQGPFFLPCTGVPKRVRLRGQRERERDLVSVCVCVS